MKKYSARAIALAGVAAIGLGLAFGASPASAAPQDYGNIDESRLGSINVHKYLHQSGAVLGDLSTPPAAGDFDDPVEGVEFTAYPLLRSGIPLDLAVATNWDFLNGLTAGVACAAPTGFTLGAPVTFPLTDAAGLASVSLGLGAYQVCETDAPANIVDRSAPFIVTVPMPYEDGWVYDVHAYPKNGDASIEKTIDAQEGLGLGAPIRFPVTSAIPTMIGEAWTGYAIRDTFDARLTPNTTTAGIRSVKVDGVDLDETFYTKTVVGNTVTMQFTAAGLAWLDASPTKTGKVIEVVFDAVVAEVGNGVIPNTAELWVNNPTLDPSVRPGLPSPEVHSNWGELEILKRAAGTTGSQGVLEGAVFEVYSANSPYAADCSTVTPTGTALSIDGVTRFTTNAAGVVAIDGLFVSDSENPSIDAATRCYVLKEVAAPAGYVLPADPFTPVAVAIGAVTTDNVEIENAQQLVPGLPLTGGSGTAILIGLGVAGGFITLGLVLLARRRNTHGANAA